jgi:hypothetical protein
MRPYSLVSLHQEQLPGTQHRDQTRTTACLAPVRFVCLLPQQG